MNVLNNIDFKDFYFNGHYLSDFGGFVGGSERLSKYPLLPSRVYVTGRAISQDGETVFGSHLEPRTFEVPIFFENIDYAGLRQIAGWLNTNKPEWFYYKDDNLKIKCTLDSNGTFLESLAENNGEVSLKFIAHDPYYYELNETEHTNSNLTGTTHRFSLTNNGNVEAFPFISIWGSGNITVNVYKGNLTTLYTTCSISSLITGVELNTKYRTCITQAGSPMFNNFSGTFPKLPVGNYILEVLGNVTKVDIKPHFRYV